MPTVNNTSEQQQKQQQVVRSANWQHLDGSAVGHTGAAACSSAQYVEQSASQCGCEKNSASSDAAASQLVGCGTGPTTIWSGACLLLKFARDGEFLEHVRRQNRLQRECLALQIEVGRQQATLEGTTCPGSCTHRWMQVQSLEVVLENTRTVHALSEQDLLLRVQTLDALVACEGRLEGIEKELLVLREFERTSRVDAAAAAAAVSVAKAAAAAAAASATAAATACGEPQQQRVQQLLQLLQCEQLLRLQQQRIQQLQRHAAVGVPVCLLRSDSANEDGLHRSWRMAWLSFTYECVAERPPPEPPPIPIPPEPPPSPPCHDIVARPQLEQAIAARRNSLAAHTGRWCVRPASGKLWLWAGGAVELPQ